MAERSVADIVVALGGREHVAAECGVTYAAVCNWCQSNRFPSLRYLDLAALCRRKRVKLPLDLFRRAA